MVLKKEILFCVLSVMAWQVYCVVNCSEKGAGRFPEPNDTTCKNYTLCVYNAASGNYMNYTFVCPSTSVFNPLTHKCAAPYSYACKVTTTSTTTTTVASSSSISTSTSTSTSPSTSTSTSTSTSPSTSTSTSTSTSPSTSSPGMLFLFQ